MFLTTLEPDKSSPVPELSARLRIKPVMGAAKPLNSRVFLKFQGPNSPGSVEQVMKDVKSRNAAPAKQGGLNAEIQSRIGHQLRAMYDDVVRQGVPDRFAELIRKLDTPEDGSPPTAKNDGRD
jgi:hypothetical protein